MVSQSTFRIWRIGVAVLALINFILMAATYIRARVLYGNELVFVWGDYAQIIVSVVLLFTTWYGAFGKPLPNNPPVFRAFILLALAVLLLYLNLRAIHLAVQFSADYGNGFSPFSCGGDAYCMVSWAGIFFSVFLGFFVLFDVALTLKVGPVKSAGAAPTVVEVVQPPQGGYYPPQPYYAPQPGQMQQQQQYYQQPMQQQQQQQYYQQPMQQQQQQQQQYYQQPMQQQQHYQQPVQQLNPDGSHKTEQYEQPSPYQAQSQPYSPQHSPFPQSQPQP